MYIANPEYAGNPLESLVVIYIGNDINILKSKGLGNQQR